MWGGFRLPLMCSTNLLPEQLQTNIFIIIIFCNHRPVHNFEFLWYCGYFWATYRYSESPWATYWYRVYTRTELPNWLYVTQENRKYCAVFCISNQGLIWWTGEGIATVEVHLYWLFAFQATVQKEYNCCVHRIDIALFFHFSQVFRKFCNFFQIYFTSGVLQVFKLLF